MKSIFRTISQGTLVAISLSALLIGALTSPALAEGKVFTVNSTLDEVDKRPGDGLCLTASGHCTLRAAIQEANALPAGSTINLSAGTYVLTIPGADEDASATGDLDIAKSMTITGAGVGKTIIDGNGPNGPNGVTDRVFQVLNTAAAVNLSGVTIQNGSIGENGAGILNNSPKLTLTGVAVSKNSTFQGNCTDGGGIYNSGTLRLFNSSVTGNAAFCDGPGILNTGAMEIQDSTISNNGTSEGDGGGIFNTGSAKLLRVTVSGNWGFNQGGGIRSDGSMTLTNVTISGNSAGNTCGGILGSANTTMTNVTVANNRVSVAGAGVCVGGRVLNTIIANNVAGAGNSANCSTAINSLGYNLSSDGTCRLTGPGDHNNTDPMLGPLANNGGFTMTQALLQNSPAIDAASKTTFPPTDQRGVTRPRDGNGDDIAISDIGAYEFTRP